MKENFEVSNIIRHRFGTDGNGITTLVGLNKCHLMCPYCLNKNILKSNNLKIYTPEELLDEIMIDYCYFLATNGGVTFGGGEPLLHFKEIEKFAKIIPKGINITIETSLNLPINRLITLFPYINNYIIDIKSMNPKIYRAYTGRKIDELLDNLKYIEENNAQEKCLIRIPLIKNYNDENDILNSKKILEEMNFKNFDIFEYLINRKNLSLTEDIITTEGLIEENTYPLEPIKNIEENKE